MKVFAIVFILFVSLTPVESCAGGAAPHLHDSSASLVKPKKTLTAFRSEYELKSFLKKLRKKRGGGGGGGSGEGFGMGSAAGAPMAMESTVTVAASANAPESITNVQHVGVDEGGIVKTHGDHLVILRRGRLFTVSIKDNTLKPVSSIDAFGPDINPDSSWYDEMLISDNTIVVIGFSYERGGTEVGLFNIDDEGMLKYRSTYHMRSNDYYSSRNYSSRLIKDKLIFYAPLDLSLDEDDVTAELPAVRKWRKGVTDKDFKRIIRATSIYRGQRNFDSEDYLTLHTVTTCTLQGNDMSCEAASVLGPSGNVFYVSPRSVYVWAVNMWDEDDGTRPILYRLPLDSAAPTAVEASGSPVDQFSFLESEDGHLNVLVRSEGKGDGMWAAETAEGDVALMRISVDSFSDGSVPVPASNYRQLPKPSGYSFQNRFVGDYVLYGSGQGWEDDGKERSPLFAAKWTGAPGIWSLPLPHAVDRIEPIGRDSIVIGTGDKDLHFTTLQLGNAPTITDRYVFGAGAQGESRSHGFFYKQLSETNGILGLPVLTRTARKTGSDGNEESASMVFLENRSLRLKPLGELRSQLEPAADDGCKASCVDWYGNARPLFLRGRIFALMGYELVEGQIEAGAVKEMRRTNFAPGVEKTARQ